MSTNHDYEMPAVLGKYSNKRPGRSSSVKSENTQKIGCQIKLKQLMRMGMAQRKWVAVAQI